MGRAGTGMTGSRSTRVLFIVSHPVEGEFSL
jgi:hypothetical protein